jgi:hypothetical protein
VPDLTQVTYCGLYCGLCAQRNRIPERARALREAMEKEGWHKWGQSMPQFTEFWAFLGSLIARAEGCSCRQNNCGAPFCGVRKCAQEKGIEVCAFCAEYPCHRIDGLAQGYVMMLADAKRMKEIGLDAWIQEQEERKKTGFNYVDTRCHSYTVPDK